MVDDEVVVRNRSRSNGVFSVSAGGRRYVVKGLELHRAGEEEQGSPARERALYARLARSPDLAAATPAPRRVAALGELLVLDRVGHGETLEARLRERGPSVAAGRMLGEALAAWRRISRRFADLAQPGRPPWVLRALDESPPGVVEVNPRARRLAASLRADDVLVTGLARLRAGWRDDAVVHGDVRTDNVVLDGARALLVDWEYLDLGDPGWDVACALADVVALEALEHSAGGGDFAAGFTAGYRAGLPRSTAAGDLAAGERLLPARLVQLAFLHAAWGDDEGLGPAHALAERARDTIAASESSPSLA